MKTRRSTLTHRWRSTRSLALVGLAMMLLGVAWDVGLHAQDPEFATDAGIALWAVPAHQVVAAGALLAAISLSLSYVRHRTLRRARPPRPVVRIVQALGVFGLACSALILVASGERARSAFHIWLLGASAPTEAAALRLHYRLLADPIDPQSIPNDFRLADVGPHLMTERLLAHRAVAGVNVFLQGPDLSDRIGYRIFSSATDAAGYFQPVDLDRSFTLVSRSIPTDTAQPARCETYRYSVEGTGIIGTDCLLLVGDVVVIGTAAREGNSGLEQTARAEGLAKIGAEHLDKLISQPR